MNPEKRKQYLDSAIAQYDFERVRSVMMFLGWNWYFPGEEDRVPEVEEMDATVRDLAAAVDGGHEYAFTGGFMVSRTHKQDGYYWITFCI